MIPRIITPSILAIAAPTSIQRSYIPSNFPAIATYHRTIIRSRHPPTQTSPLHTTHSPKPKYPHKPFINKHLNPHTQSISRNNPFHLPMALLSTSSSPSLTPVFSEGEDPVKMQEALGELLIDGGGKWKLVSEGKGVERVVKFKTFKTTMEFINAIATECARKEIRHHPEWSNVYNTTTIRWTTHKPSGLSSKDIIMARFTDSTASSLGELPVDL